MTTHSTPSQPTTAERSGWFYRLYFERRARRRVMALMGVLTLLFILLVAFFSFQTQLLPYDEVVSQGLREVRVASFTTLSEGVSFLGFAPWNAMLALGIGGLVALWLGWKVGLYLMAITLFQGLMTVLLRFPIQTPRPMETDLNAPFAIIEHSSFPSGHVALYVVLFGFTVYLLFRHRAPPLVRTGSLLLAGFLVLLIGPARVHLGAHWVADVVASYLLGFFLLLLSIELYEHWFLKKIGGTEE